MPKPFSAEGVSRKPDEHDEGLSRLAAGIAHDLNNLLTAILGRLELMAMELAEDHPLRDDLSEVREDARTAARVVARLIEFTGQAPTRPKTTKIAELLRGIEERVIDRRGGEVRILTVLESGIGPVRVDPDQIRRVIHALVDNALEAIPEEGVLLIRTSRTEVTAAENDGIAHLEPGRYVRLAVIDNGRGMDAETLDRVFDPYFSTKPTGSGRGLQLAAAGQIVRQNGGGLLLESQRGKGTEARLYLPLERARE